VDFFLASQGIPDAVLILEEEVPAHSEEQAEETLTAAVILRAAEISAPNAVGALTAHSEVEVSGPEVEVSGRMEALAISAPPRLLAISIAPEVGNQCRETRGRETLAAMRADGIHLETRPAGRCPPQHAAGEMRRAVGGIPSVE
jgi:hypothetical protein